MILVVVDRSSAGWAQFQSYIAGIVQQSLTRHGWSFPVLARKVTEAFTLSGDERLASLKSTHSIGNLALLSGEANSVLSNAVFEVKRQRIIELDRAGEYIPICTRRVFLKYYTHSGSQQLHFWSTQDRMAYLEAMLQMIAPYFMPEEAK